MIDAPKNPQVARYIEGMRAWRAELEGVRPVLLGAGLDEEYEWYKPCYTHDGSNVVIFQPFKELCALLFYKSALLHDPDGALKQQGKNTRSALRLEFRSVADVTAAKRTIAALVQDAIRVEQAGLSVPKRAPADDGPYPEELDMLLDADPALRNGWERLTPGRRRGWLLHFTGAKQSKTRIARIDRATPRILGRLRDARLESQPIPTPEIGLPAKQAAREQLTSPSLLRPKSRVRRRECHERTLRGSAIRTIATRD